MVYVPAEKSDDGVAKFRLFDHYNPAVDKTGKSH